MALHNHEAGLGTRMRAMRADRGWETRMTAPYHITLLQTEDGIEVATTRWDGRTFGHACYLDSAASLGSLLKNLLPGADSE
ncbi:MAG: hypothetical protein JO270_12550 [Acidobacteriaceae bacterium]|nr:hypothetical protein [Acidobacteriaceae bacterium]